MHRNDHGTARARLAALLVLAMTVLGVALPVAAQASASPVSASQVVPASQAAAGTTYSTGGWGGHP
jgi:hypothetical protein